MYTVNKNQKTKKIYQKYISKRCLNTVHLNKYLHTIVRWRIYYTFNKLKYKRILYTIMVIVVRLSLLPFHFQRSIPLLFPYSKSDCVDITCLVKNASSYLFTTLISRLTSFEPSSTILWIWPTRLSRLKKQILMTM